MTALDQHVAALLLASVSVSLPVLQNILAVCCSAVHAQVQSLPFLIRLLPQAVLLAVL